MKNYCPDLFQNLYIQKLNEYEIQLGFCCVSKLSEPLDLINFEADFLQSQRQHFINTDTLPPSCNQCITNEKINSTSRRLQQLTYWPNHNFSTKNNLKLLQYNCDNICNLKCIACSGLYSSSWLEDEKLLGMLDNVRIKPTKHNELMFNFDVSNIREIYFNGGEPLLTKDHIKVLEYMLNSADSKNIHILYNTNATLTLKDEFLKLWEKFASVTLIASIDAVDTAFEYIRYPADWNNVKNNLMNYSKYTKINIGTNIGVHNIMYFSDLYNFATENNIQFNFQSDTQGKLSLKNTPRHLIGKIKNYLAQAQDSTVKETLLSTLDSVRSPDLDWIRYLGKLDKIRNNSWKVSLSRLYNLDQEFFNNNG